MLTENQDRGQSELRVVLYLRQSDKEQRLSIAQQRQECQTYAQSRGWRIVGEYLDDGKSGSKSIEKRKDFFRLLEDAEKRDRQWRAILCWDTSRFGRLDSLAGAEYKQRLRKAGVWMETAKGERIDWSTSMGRIMDTLRSEADNQYSLDLSKNAIRGRRAVLDLGFWATAVPYGYDRQYVEGGQVKLLVRRKEVFAKPRNWRLVAVANPEEAEVVKFLFNEWATKDLSFGATIKLLRDRRVPSPAGQPTWSLAQVKRLLKERAYVGDIEIGTGERSREVHNRIGKQAKTGVVPAFVDARVFEVVQAKVKLREGGEWKAKSNSGPLSGILLCGHCGYRLARRRYNGMNYYVCESPMRRPHLGCCQWRVNEQQVMPVIAPHLLQAVEKEVVHRLAAKPPAKDPKELDRLRREEQQLSTRLQRATKHLLLLDTNLIPEAQKSVLELQRLHEETISALRSAEARAADGSDGVSSWWAAAKDNLVAFTARVAEAGPMPYDYMEGNPPYMEGREGEMRAGVLSEVATVRELFRSLKVEVHFWWERHGKRNWRLQKGVLRAAFKLGVVVEKELDVSAVTSGSPSRLPLRPDGRRPRCR